jgi:DNA ligase (NAD+)
MFLFLILCFVLFCSFACRLLFGLGIRHIGLESAKLLVSEFGGFRPLWEYLLAVSSASASTSASLSSDSPIGLPPAVGASSTMSVVRGADRLLNISGVGSVTAASLLLYARNPENVELVEGILSQMVPSLDADRAALKISSPTNAKDEARGSSQTPLRPLQGRVVVFSGALQSGVSRSDAHKRCEALGASTRASINKSVNLLICGGGDDNADDKRTSAESSKIRKARSYGIEIWSESQWNDFLAQVQQDPL